MGKLRVAGIAAVISMLGWVPISFAQGIVVPNAVTAGTEATISSSGSGEATMYLLGPGVSMKRPVNLGEPVHFGSEATHYAGRYLVLLCSGSCQSAEFEVSAATPSDLAFLVHPSRVPVGQADAVSGVALLFDQFGNLVMSPQEVKFDVHSTKEKLFTHQVSAHDGEAWFRTASGKAAGPVQLTASAGALSASRVVQQIAAEPCNLRIKAQQTAKYVDLETEPVRDCAGNSVSDGTIVTFTGSGPDGKISVDAPVKGGIARARFDLNEPISISAACGIAMGNQLRIERRP
ncbi:MAG TPA: hypothetical protein VKV39_20110 [Candidatus Sulfotelmatobacter sp.]|nr:hypothetical protein [Candidatus Sulfotelmatobacter sp.]